MIFFAILTGNVLGIAEASPQLGDLELHLHHFFELAHGLLVVAAGASIGTLGFGDQRRIRGQRMVIAALLPSIMLRWGHFLVLALLFLGPSNVVFCTRRC